MYKVGIIGAFAKGKSSLDGQTVKTCSLSSLLKKELGDLDVFDVDTYGWKKNPFGVFCRIIKACRHCDKIIMLPAQNALHIIPIVAQITKRKESKLIYSVIGGWLPSMLQDKKYLGKPLQKLDSIWVETSTMKCALEKQGFKNISIVNNFKKFKPIKVRMRFSPPYRLCIFSRIMWQKGIEDAIKAIMEINEKIGVTYMLDIYGMVDNGNKERFSEICTELPDYIKYCGCVNPSDASMTLKEYFALLFPTRFYTEGIPGTIIDAYSASVPVISSRWQSFNDVIEEGKTGFGYRFGDYNALVFLLESLADNPSTIISLRQNCLNKSYEYSEEYVGSKLLKLIFE